MASTVNILRSLCLLLSLTLVFSLKINTKSVQKPPSEAEDLTFVQQGHKVDLRKALGNNSLFNEISGYKPTGGILGQIFASLGSFIDDLSGLDDKENSQMEQNLEAC